MIAARKRICAKVMFSQVSVCSRGTPTPPHTPPSQTYGWQAVGTHHTGMLSCLFILLTMASM